MKRIFNFLFVSLLALSLTGCLKHNVSMEVKEDKSVTLEMVYEVALDKSLMEGSESNSAFNEEDYNFLKELGYNVNTYENEKDNQKITGVKITKKFDNIDDITTDKKDKVNLVNIFDEKKKEEVKNIKLFYKDKDQYVSNFKFNYQEDNSNDNSNMNLSSYQSMFNLEYKVKLPKEAVRNNATSVSEDKTEYTWKLDYSKNNDIDYAFTLGNTFPIIFIIIAGVALTFAVIIVVVILLVSKSKKKNNNQTLNNNLVNNPNFNNNVVNNQELNNGINDGVNNQDLNNNINN